MTDRPVVDVVHSDAALVRRRARHAGAVAIAALLSASVIPLDGTVPRSGRVSREARSVGEIADAERGRDAWSRLGDLLNDVMRNTRQDHPDGARNVREPSSQHMIAPVQKDAPPLNRPNRGR